MLTVTQSEVTTQEPADALFERALDAVRDDLTPKTKASIVRQYATQTRASAVARTRGELEGKEGERERLRQERTSIEDRELAGELSTGDAEALSDGVARRLKTVVREVADLKTTLTALEAQGMSSALLLAASAVCTDFTQRWKLRGWAITPSRRVAKQRSRNLAPSRRRLSRRNASGRRPRWRCCPRERSTIRSTNKTSCSRRSHGQLRRRRNDRAAVVNIRRPRPRRCRHWICPTLSTVRPRRRLLRRRRPLRRQRLRRLLLPSPRDARPARARARARCVPPQYLEGPRLKDLGRAARSTRSWSSGRRR